MMCIPYALSWASEIFPFDYLLLFFCVLPMIAFVYRKCAPQSNGFTFSLVDAAAAADVMMQFWDANFLNAFRKLIKLVSFSFSFSVDVGWYFFFFFVFIFHFLNSI